MKNLQDISAKTKKASFEVAHLGTNLKNKILLKIAKSIKENAKKILDENKKDVAAAKKNKLPESKINRLILDEKKILNLSKSVEDIAKLPDPVAKILLETKRENGLHIKKITIPIGVLLAIYESRPNVTSDIAALSLKSGNAVILRCGSDCFNSSKILAEIYRDVLEEFSIDKNAISFVASTDRNCITELLKMDNFIDVVIPRGGKSLIKTVIENSKIPVFRHLDGNCHTYIHEAADFDKARKILLNAKMRRVEICGATESLLIDQKIAKKILPLIVDDLSKVDCEIRGDTASKAIDKRIKKAEEKDFYEEYLDKILSVKIVKNLEEAIAHIAKYGSMHTESIITEDKLSAEKFCKKVDSAIVMHNASTQFADGGEFGFGAEVGISTGKLHARGPVGLNELVTYKYVVDANCALRK